MATILKRQTSLYISAIKWIILSFTVVIIGRLFVILGDIYAFITIATLVAFPVVLGKSFNFLIGAWGEQMVTNELNKFGNDYFLINDICLPGLQIDHTLICPKGIFTIETKTYFGEVEGNGNDKYWTYRLNKYSKSIYSPVMQSRRHSVKLSELLKEKGLNHFIDSIVVFAGSTKININPKPIPVLDRKQLYDYIYRLPDKISKEDVLNYKDKIMSLL